MLQDTAVDTVDEQRNQRLDSLEICDEKTVTPSDNFPSRFPLACNRSSGADGNQRASEISNSFSTSSSDKFLDREEGELSSADEDDETCSAQRSSKEGCCEEGLINMTGKSYVCILHEYCQNVLRRPPTYQTVVLENDRNPYQLTVVIDGKPYASGVGQSKKHARLEAVTSAPLGVNVVTVKSGAVPGKRRRRRRAPNTTGLRCQAVRPVGNKPDSTTGSHSLDKEKGGSKELMGVKTQVFSVKDKEMEYLLTSEEIRAYCSRLFEVKVDETPAPKNVDREGVCSENKENGESRSRVLMMPEEAKVIRYQLPPVEGDPTRRQLKARNALSRLIPDFDKIVGSDNHATGPPVASERDIQLFDDILVTDPRLYEMSVRMAFPTPYNLLVECLNRSCVPETELKSNMTSHGRSKHFFSLQLREHTVKVPCKNKREGRHLAAQHLLSPSSPGNHRMGWSVAHLWPR
ncbi:hypothetical protein AHF37_07447 [Paragonimus kellicotti]|nr:hypothetical protein AHF37_07447 [Paragonimus kellicotti]